MNGSLLRADKKNRLVIRKKQPLTAFPFYAANGAMQRICGAMVMKFWEISDRFWEEVKPLIPEKTREPGRVYQRLAGGGRKPLDPRKVFSAIVYVLKTGIQWKALPKEWYGSPSSIHAYFKKWEKQGLFGELWKRGLAGFEEMKGIVWELALDPAPGLGGDIRRQQRLRHRARLAAGDQPPQPRTCGVPV